MQSQLSRHNRKQVAVPDLIVILGATATGKTSAAVAVARARNGEIISADSRQVYRGMDIGTGKDLDEYGDIPCHLIDIAEPGEEYSVFRFQREFFKAFESIRARGRLPVCVGGSGLYLEAVLKGYRLVEVPENPALRAELEPLSIEELARRLITLKPEQHNTTDLLERPRLVRAIEIAAGEAAAGEPDPLPVFQARVFGIRWPRDELRRRITRRLERRLSEGMIEEVERLLAGGIEHQTLEHYGLEYRYISHMLRGELDRPEMFRLLNLAIHKFAKRQETWFRRMEKRGTEIRWVDGAGAPSAGILAALGPHSA
jgi:tRNA dimethylallyltransferase